MHLTNQPNIIINVYNLIFFLADIISRFWKPSQFTHPLSNSRESISNYLHLAAPSGGDCKCGGCKGKQREVFNFKEARNLFSIIKPPFLWNCCCCHVYFLYHHSCISVFWAPALQYFKPSHPDQQLKQHGSCSQVFPSNQSLETSIHCHKIVRSISLSQVERFHWDFAPQRVEIFQHQGKIWLRPTSPLGMMVFFFHPPLDSFGTENVKVE